MKKSKVYFLGAGDIAATMLERFVNASDVEILGIGTQIDRLAGRNKKLTPTPVAIVAEKYGFVPQKLANVNDELFLAKLKEMNLDFIIVISFGQLLKKDILNLPKFGCINIHASILPKYRGASPIISAILNGESESGVSIMQMAETMDTGDVFSIIKTPINSDDTAEILEKRLGEIAGDNLSEILLKIQDGVLKATPQDHKLATVCRKIKKEHGIINFLEKDAYQIEAMTKAFTPWPNASTSFLLKNDKIIKVNIIQVKAKNGDQETPAKILKADKSGFEIACNNNTNLEILSLNVPGKKIMTAREFLNGYTPLEIVQ